MLIILPKCNDSLVKLHAAVGKVSADALMLQDVNKIVSGVNDRTSISTV